MGTTPNICTVIFIQIDLIQSLLLLRGQSVLISFCKRRNIATVSYVEILRWELWHSRSVARQPTRTPDDWRCVSDTAATWWFVFETLTRRDLALPGHAVRWRFHQCSWPIYSTCIDNGLISAFIIMLSIFGFFGHIVFMTIYLTCLSKPTELSHQQKQFVFLMGSLLPYPNLMLLKKLYFMYYYHFLNHPPEIL